MLNFWFMKEVKVAVSVKSDINLRNAERLLNRVINSVCLCDDINDKKSCFL